jgi:hypothetical protein
VLRGRHALTREPHDPVPGDVNEPLVVRSDDRSRVSLVKAGMDPESLYLVSTEPDGTIILQPAVAIPKSEIPFSAG